MPALLPSSELAVQLQTIPQWDQDGKAIKRQFTFKDFAEAMRFTNQVAECAEAANHHPDIDIRWNKVLLQLSTHSAGGLTVADFELARRIDRIDTPLR